MTRCFADTSYYIALVSADDEAHELASSFQSINGLPGDWPDEDWLGEFLAFIYERRLCREGAEIGPLE